MFVKLALGAGCCFSLNTRASVTGYSSGIGPSHMFVRSSPHFYLLPSHWLAWRHKNGTTTTTAATATATATARRRRRRTRTRTGTSTGTAAATATAEQRAVSGKLNFDHFSAVQGPRNSVRSELETTKDGATWQGGGLVDRGSSLTLPFWLCWAFTRNLFRVSLIPIPLAEDLPHCLPKQVISQVRDIRFYVTSRPPPPAPPRPSHPPRRPQPPAGQRLRGSCGSVPRRTATARVTEQCSPPDSQTSTASFGW